MRKENYAFRDLLIYDLLIYDFLISWMDKSEDLSDFIIGLGLRSFYSRNQKIVNQKIYKLTTLPSLLLWKAASMILITFSASFGSTGLGALLAMAS